MVIYHTERALPDVVKFTTSGTAVTRAYDPTADQKIVGSGNKDGKPSILRCAERMRSNKSRHCP